ncbi:MAG: benzil reductase ((S)-benzoin forming) [Marivirga sp.]
MKTLFIITGSSKGIGKGLADYALKEDHNHVIGLSRSQTINHKNYNGISCDLSNVEQLETAAETLLKSKESYERIALINNAGTLGDVKQLGNIKPAAITQLFNLNVIAPILLMNAFMRVYENFKGAKIIINVSSGAGKRPVDGWSGYCASKAAIDMATQVAYEENRLAKNHFQIRAIAPGVVDTEMQQQIRASEVNDFSGVKKFAQLKANDELSTEKEVAEKFFLILNNLEKYNDPILDVRDI